MIFFEEAAKTFDEKTELDKKNSSREFKSCALKAFQYISQYYGFV